jgi:hypothetical protein
MDTGFLRGSSQEAVINATDVKQEPEFVFFVNRFDNKKDPFVKGLLFFPRGC